MILQIFCKRLEAFYVLAEPVAFCSQRIVNVSNETIWVRRIVYNIKRRYQIKSRLLR